MDSTLPILSIEATQNTLNSSLCLEPITPNNKNTGKSYVYITKGDDFDNIVSVMKYQKIFKINHYPIDKNNKILLKYISQKFIKENNQIIPSYNKLPFNFL